MRRYFYAKRTRPRGGGNREEHLRRGGDHAGGGARAGAVCQIVLARTTAVTAVNQVIKTLAVFAGCLLCLRPGKCLLKGAAAGLGTVVVTYFLFAIVAGEISFGWSNVLDWVFGVAIGAVSGIVAGFVRK